MKTAVILLGDGNSFNDDHDEVIISPVLQLPPPGAP